MTAYIRSKIDFHARSEELQIQRHPKSIGVVISSKDCETEVYFSAACAEIVQQLADELKACQKQLEEQEQLQGAPG